MVGLSDFVFFVALVVVIVVAILTSCAFACEPRARRKLLISAKCWIVFGVVAIGAVVVDHKDRRVEEVSNVGKVTEVVKVVEIVKTAEVAEVAEDAEVVENLENVEFNEVGVWAEEGVRLIPFCSMTEKKAALFSRSAGDCENSLDI